MKKTTFILILLFFSITNRAIADNADVSATVPSSSSTFYAPTLISPTNNQALNNPLITFNWLRPSPLPSDPLDHYDFFIDDAIFAAAVPDNLVSQDYYFYTATASGNYFYVTLKQAIAQGYHTWRVAAYDTVGNNAATSNWTFYVDSVAPFISLTQVNTTSYSWNTSVSGSIPDESSRYLTVTSNNPTIKGNVETNANLLISLICPTPAPSGCTNQSWISNSTDGSWEKQFTSLSPNQYYSVNIAATDATGNSTIFPVFYLKYAQGATVTATTTPKTTATPTATLTPTPTLPSATTTQSPLPTLTSKLTPPPELAALVTPTAFIPKTPPSPTLPPNKNIVAPRSTGYGWIVLLLFLCFGLPTHLLMTSFALSANLKNLLSFIFTLGFPFLRRKNNSTYPFTFVEVYDPNRVKKTLYKTVSDIKGNLYFPNNFPPKVLVVTKNTNRFLADQIMPSMYLSSTCLIPLPKRLLNSKESLQNYFYNLRSIPLIVGILTSSVGLYFFPSAYLGGYLYLSLQYAFSEYYYPRIK